jgi:hydroxylaminobenzene mutase
VTLIKALLKVHGIDFIGETANDVIFGALTLTVVLPTLVSSWLWMQGLRRGLANAQSKA